MSNRKNQRRGGQGRRYEKGRKPVVVTKAKAAFVGTLPGERARKEQERYRKRPTKTERKERDKRIRRWRLGTGLRVKPIRKPRTKYGNTYWNHSHDV